MQNYFYRDQEGREIGPLDLATLAKFRSAGVVSADTLIRATDSTDWKPCREIIADAPVAPTATPQPTSLPAGRQSIWPVIALVAIVGFLIYARQKDNSRPMDAIPEKKTTFQKIVFTEPQYGSTITLISETGCEIKKGNQIFLAEYTRQENKLRVIERALGTASVDYFDILPEGLRQSDTGEMYLLPEPLKRYQDQVRAAQEAEQARQIAAKLEQENQAAELRKRLIASRDAVMQDVRQFLSKGTVFNGTYYSEFKGLGEKRNDPNLPYQVTITGGLTIDHNANTSDPLDENFRIPAHFKWLGDIEPLSPFGTTFQKAMQEYDGMFMGEVRKNNGTGMNAQWGVTMKYFISVKSLEWISGEGGSTWDGTQFKGNRKAAISLLKP